MIWIAVDAMGGDDAPRHVVDGALAAARALRSRRRARRSDAAASSAELRAASRMSTRRASGSSTRPTSIAMDGVAGRGAAAQAAGVDQGRRRVGGARRGRRRSFSAGHTGATVMAAHGAFGMLPGVDRPALAATIPTRRQSGDPARRRRQRRVPAAAPAAVRGDGQRLRARGVRHRRRRASGLLSIGEEATKGNELTREAHRLLKASPLAFIGNVEARDVYSGDADVIVCDGFTGNVALKISEGLVDVVEGLLSEELSSTITMRVGSLLTRRALRRFRRRVDYSEYGGAPLLGVGRRRHRRPRPVERQGGAQRRRHGLSLRRRRASSNASSRTSPPRRCPTIDRVHLSRPGIAEGRHGQGAGRRVSRSAARRSTKPTRRSASRSAASSSKARRIS